MEHPYSIAWDREPVARFRISGELDGELAEAGTVGPPRRAESSQPGSLGCPRQRSGGQAKRPLARLDSEAGGVAHGSVFNHKRTGSLCIGTTDKQKRTTAEGR